MSLIVALMAMRADHVSQSGRKGNRVSTGLFACVLGILLILTIASLWIDDASWRWIQLHPMLQLTRLCGRISRYGDWPELMVLGVMALFAAWLARSQSFFRLVLCMIIASTLAGAFVNSLRLVTGRTRPNNVAATQGWYGLQYRGKSLLRNNKFHSFPSGHTGAAFAFFGVLALRFRAWTWLVLFLPAAIGFSRFFIGAHHLSDVLAGCFFGLVFAWFAAAWIEPWLQGRLTGVSCFRKWLA